MKTYGFSSNSILDVSGKLFLVRILILVQQVLHVVGNVHSEDVFAMSFGVELLGLIVVTGETLGRVWDVDTTVHGSLHGSEDTGAGGGAGKAGVEACAEGPGAVGSVLNHEVVSVDLGLALVKAVQVQLFEDLETNKVYRILSFKFFKLFKDTVGAHSYRYYYSYHLKAR